MPLTLLASLLIVWITILLIDRRLRRRNAFRIGEIGRVALMNFAAVDRFDLRIRVLAAAPWHALTSELDVKDVLYGTIGAERCFIFSARVSPSADMPPTRFLLRLIESAADGSVVDLQSQRSANAHSDQAAYQAYADDWSRRHPSMTT